jgi:hypothetical protein
VSQRDAAYAVGQPLQEVLPAVGGADQDVVVLLHVRHDVLDDGIEQRLAARNVPVQRHGLDAELLAEPAHREAREPVGLDELQRRDDDPVAAERLPLRGRQLPAHHRGVGVDHAVIRRRDVGLALVGLAGRGTHRAHHP